MALHLRKENFYRRQAFDRRSADLGFIIDWWVFKSEDSSVSNLYDESGEKVFSGRKRVPLLWFYDVEAGDRLTPEGRKEFRQIDFAVSIIHLRNAGIDPDPEMRVNDIVKWDNRYWRIVNFQMTSQSSLTTEHTHNVGDDSTAHVTAIIAYDTDLPFDQFPPTA